MELVRAFATAAVGFVVTRWRPGIRMRVRDFTDLLGFNASTWGAWGITYLDGELPRTLIARSLGSAAVGLYSMAMRLFDQVVTLLMRPAYQVVQTGAARAQEDPAAVGELALGTMRASVVLAAPLFLGIAAISPVLVPLVFGPEWAGAVGVIQVMMLFAVRSPVTMVQTAIIRGMGKAHWHLGVAALGVCLTLAVLAVSLPYGLVAVAAAMGVRGILLFPSYAVLVRRLTGLSVRDQALASVGATVSALVMAAVVLGALAWLPDAVGRLAALAIAVPGGAVVYWAALRVFARPAARVVDSVLAAAVRRDRAGLRAALGGAGGS
jgi:O-antigen/teichoic acid export membrane protein